MSRQKAMEHYRNAQKLARKYYNTSISQGKYPYPQVLTDLIEESDMGDIEELGLIDIPVELITGTWTSGRKSAFAGNFMPLLDIDSEFGWKWINLCCAHLGTTGIKDPIQCFEYLGHFYVREGHKRVSVLKSYGAVTISGYVTRVLPGESDDIDIRNYNEFLDFYRLSKTYLVRFSRLGSFAKLQALMGMTPDHVWSADERAQFSSNFTTFKDAYDHLKHGGLLLTHADALLVYLEVYPYSQLSVKTSVQVRKELEDLLPDLRLYAQGEPISVQEEPLPLAGTFKPLFFFQDHLKIAFIYDRDPSVSPWASAHLKGQRYLEDRIHSSIEVSQYICEPGNLEPTIQKAISEGVRAVFATSPTLLEDCRKIAVKYKDLCIFNCSLSMPYAGVRSYYCRIYEGKFLAGCIAGAMSDTDDIGYVADYPIMGVCSAINAFALGVQMTRPKARIHLKWSCLPGNPVEDLLKEGIHVISNRDTADAQYGPGTFMVQDNDVIHLATPIWNWGKYYEKVVRAMLINGLDSLRDSKHAVNDWWGLASGVVDIHISEDLPQGVLQMADIMKNSVIRNESGPFYRSITDQNGTLHSNPFSPEEIMCMDWLCENVEGSIPEYEELMMRSRDLVRLLGIYRQWIPPLPKGGE